MSDEFVLSSTEASILRLSFPNTVQISEGEVKQVLLNNHLPLPSSYARKQSFCRYFPLYEVKQQCTFTFDYLKFTDSTDARLAKQLLSSLSCGQWKRVFVDLVSEAPTQTQTLSDLVRLRTQQVTPPVLVLPRLHHTLPTKRPIEETAPVCKHCRKSCSECSCPTFSSYWCRVSGERIDKCALPRCPCQTVRANKHSINNSHQPL